MTSWHFVVFSKRWNFEHQSTFSKRLIWGASLLGDLFFLIDTPAFLLPS
jgi:hypothetical protein